MPESSNKGGRKPRVTDEDLLDVFRATPDPVLSTVEVADAVPIKRRETLNRLQALKEDGELESKQIGGRNTGWWLVDERGGSDTDRRSPATADPAPVDEERDTPPEAPESTPSTTPWRMSTLPRGASARRVRPPRRPLVTTFASTGRRRNATSSPRYCRTTRSGMTSTARWRKSRRATATEGLGGAEG